MNRANQGLRSIPGNRLVIVTVLLLICSTQILLVWYLMPAKQNTGVDVVPFVEIEPRPHVRPPPVHGSVTPAVSKAAEEPKDKHSESHQEEPEPEPEPEDKSELKELAMIKGDVLEGVPTSRMRVLFGRHQVPVISHEKDVVTVAVPPSDYPGIGYNVTVSVRVYVGEDDKPIAKSSWTYPPTVPATAVANTGIFWIDDTRELHQKVLRLFSDRLGPKWRIQLLITTDIIDELLNLSSLIRDETAAGRFIITPKEKGTRTLYARTCTYPEYWEMLQGDRLLVFQSDSVPCSGSNHEIDEFFDYDYVGAPWVYNDHEGGNGGLSLRNRTAVISMLKHNIEETQRQASQDNFDWEDDLYRLSKLPPRSTHFLAHRRTQNKR